MFCWVFHFCYSKVAWWKSSCALQKGNSELSCHLWMNLKLKVFSIWKTKTFTDRMLSTKGTVLVATITSVRPWGMWKCKFMNTQTLVMTLNLPVTYARIHLTLFVSEFFVQPILFTSAEIIIEGLMIQQWSPSLNKQVHSYVAKLFPSGIT